MDRKARILVAGLSGAGKTTMADALAHELAKDFKVARINADDIRELTKNWDFSIDGRIRQAKEMYNRCELGLESMDIVICDFIAPLEILRKIFEADYTVWMDTVQESEYADTDAIFEPINDADCIVFKHHKENLQHIVDDIKLRFS